jgi:hypothetical protein
MITYQEKSSRNKHNDFALSLLKGRIGESVIETYLVASGYQVYPYGYEYSYANITRFVRKDQSDVTTTKIRSMPDLLVCDPDNNERFLLQIKASSTPDESSFWIKKDDFDNYSNYWSEALLVVYSIRTGKIYCLKIADIKNPREGMLRGTSENGFFLDLANFHDFTKYFNLITPYQYLMLNKEISNILNNFSPIVIRSKSKKVSDAQSTMNLELSL